MVMSSSLRALSGKTKAPLKKQRRLLALASCPFAGMTRTGSNGRPANRPSQPTLGSRHCDMRLYCHGSGGRAGMQATRRRRGWRHPGEHGRNPRIPKGTRARPLVERAMPGGPAGNTGNAAGAARNRRKQAMKRLMGFVRRMRDERGVTGLETAIILIAFVVVAAVFAFVVLSTGLFSSERGKEAVYAGLSKTRGTMELSSGVVATSDGTQITALKFDVALAAGGDSVNLDPAATTNRTVISYIDSTASVSDVTYTVNDLVGNGDNLLQPGELFEVSIDTTQAAMAAITIAQNYTFTLEVKPPSVSYMVIQRTTPASISDTTLDLN